MQTKLGRKFWISMLIFGLMGQVAWVVENMYFNVFIYKMFHATAADISLMVMASAVTAALTTSGVRQGREAQSLHEHRLYNMGYQYNSLRVHTQCRSYHSHGLRDDIFRIHSQ